MKYMGSKRMMLQNGLGTLLAHELKSATRFVDLFSGSGAVATHVAQKREIEVLTFDLQQYSAVLSAAILGRTEPQDADEIWKKWIKKARAAISAYRRIPTATRLTRKRVERIRVWCSRQSEHSITKAYGGHYFSAKQALWIDALLRALPTQGPARDVAHAALIHAASKCVAAPGHTAQPFQPTRTAKRFLEEAWNRNLLAATETALSALAGMYAKKRGRARVRDANKAAMQLRPGDLVFIDPPYSGVHYSRFYHVLEAIARGRVGKVDGIGRYPTASERPRSRYSVSSEAKDALDQLLKNVAARQAKAILTFPDHKCSNGLSGRLVRRIAKKHFEIETERVKSLFSTLGGTGNKKRNGQAKRQARHVARELMLVLKPKREVNLA